MDEVCSIIFIYFNMIDFKESETPSQKYTLPQQEQELTTSEIIIFIHGYIRALIDHRWWIFGKGVLFSLLGLGIFLIQFFFISPKIVFEGKSPITYTSIIQFVAKEHSIDKLGNIQTRNIPFGEIWKLNNNSEVFDKALLQKVKLEGRHDLIANFLIDSYNLHEQWEKEETKEDLAEYNLNDFRFIDNDIISFDKRETRALLLIRNLVLGNKIRDISFDNYKGKQEEVIRVNNMVATSKGKYLPEPEVNPTIGNEESLLKVYGNNIEVTTINNLLSSKLVDAFYEELKKRYFKRTEEITDITVKRIQETSDSTLLELVEAEQVFDRDLERLQKERGRLVNDLLRSQLQLNPEELLPTDIALDFGKSSKEFTEKEQLYEELKQKIENIEFNLQNKTTEFQISNRNFIPIANIPPSRFKAMRLDGLANYLMIGFLLGFLIFSFYVLYDKMVKDALNAGK